MSDSVPDVGDTGDEVIGTAFAVLPESVLYADVSDRAVRLYATLQRFVGLPKGAIPGRKRLARLLRCSIASLDRATRELESARFLKVEHRHIKGAKGLTSSRFHLLSPAITSEDRSNHGRGQVSSLVRTPAVTGDGVKRVRERKAGRESNGNPRRRRDSSEGPPSTAARDELMERARRRREGNPKCPKCEDSGVWEDDAGFAHFCDCSIPA